MRSAKVAIVVLFALGSPLRAQTPRARLVPGTEQTCAAKLADGTNYEFHRRTLRGQFKGEHVFADVRAYYRPSSGEFLYISSVYRRSDRREHKPILPCGPLGSAVILLASSEWVEFWGSNASPRIDLFHSTLRFPSIAEAWQYVALHFAECENSAASLCFAQIPLYKELGDFFRPQSLRFDARPFTYNPLVSAKKVGPTWEVELKGADEPNRALVTLDKDFKLMKVMRFSAPK